MTRKTKIDGLDRLVEDLEKFGRESMPQLQTAAHSAAKTILVSARERIRNRSGNLYRSLYVKDGKLKSNKYVVSSYVTWGDDVRDYAAPLELGHKIKNIAGGPVLGEVQERPFLRPAADRRKRAVKKQMIEAINREIEKLGDPK